MKPSRPAVILRKINVRRGMEDSLAAAVGKFREAPDDVVSRKPCYGGDG
ncbi:MAG: hypothetical protein WDM81_14690 [Rhizomicrobium sp.]